MKADTFTDHQGSLAAYTGNAKEPVTRLSYDAWGRRRNAADGSYDNLPAQATDRGYTGHEHLDAFGLINMNGRLYDPMLGRMLSPDIVVQQTDYTQSYNRYSYCFNNPLRFTDPTGWVIDPDIHKTAYAAQKYAETGKKKWEKQLVKFGVDPKSVSVEYNTELSQEGLTAKTVSWNMFNEAGDDSRHYYDILEYNFPSLSWNKPEGQHYKLGCLAFGLVQQEGRFSGGNFSISEWSIMRSYADSQENGLDIPTVVDNTFLPLSNIYGEREFLLHTGQSFEKTVYENMELNNGVSLDLRQEAIIGKMNHFVNVEKSYRYHVGNGNQYEYDFRPWGSSKTYNELSNKISNYLILKLINKH